MVAHRQATLGFAALRVSSVAIVSHEIQAAQESEKCVQLCHWSAWSARLAEAYYQPQHSDLHTHA